MFSHVFVGVKDFERAYAFYSAWFEALGVAPRFCDRTRPWAGWQSEGGRPLFVIAAPYDGKVHDSGNGQMTAFTARSREAVRRAHRIALEHGGVDEGAPGLRPEYHANYYGAYVRDCEGNKLCVVCHDVE